MPDEEEYGYPLEMCPRCGGTLQWVQYGFSIWLGTAKEHDEYKKYYHEAGCVMRGFNRFCSRCKKYFTVRDGKFMDKEGN
jgi:ribosomal protein S27AE